MEIGVGSVGEGRSEQRPEGDERTTRVVSLEKGVLNEGKRVSKSYVVELAQCVEVRSPLC